jgi:iron complex outermembrane receptor protein
MTSYIIRLIILMFIIGLYSNNANSQTYKKWSISGVIIEHDKPLENITVLLKELKITVITSEDGRYTFKNIPEGRYTVSVKLPGLNVKEKEVNLNRNINYFDFKFTESGQKLAEVAINYYKTNNLKSITAGKSGIKSFDLPQSISIINQEIIAEQQANKLSDVIKNVNGVALGTTRGSTSETFFARGYSLGNNNILKNGSRVSAATIPEASTLESIEILKGSAALLYGNVSGGALINMVAKRPKFEYGGEISLRAGSYNLYKPIVDFYGPISKSVAFRVVGTYENAGSFRNNVSTNRTYVNPSFLYNIGKKTSLLIQVDYLKSDANPDFGIGTLNETLIPTTISRNSYFNTPWAYNKIKQTTASAELNHQVNTNWDLNFIGSYQRYDRDYFSTERIRANNIGDWNRTLTRAKTFENYYTGQINLKGKIKTGKINHTVLLGTDADTYLLNTTGFAAFSNYDIINILDESKYIARTDQPESGARTITETPTNRIGIYAQDLISINEKFKVLTGVRWSYQIAFTPDILDLQTNIKSKSTTEIQNNSAFSPRVGLVYQPTKTTSIFASYANSFEVNSGIDIYGAGLKPSLIDQFELGIKNDLIKGRLTANFTIYKIINNNLAQQAEIDVNNQPNINPLIKELSGQTTSDGFEIDMNGKIIKGLNFMGGYSYTFMRYAKTSTETGSFIVGEQLVRNVPHTANGTLFYTFSSTNLKGVKVGASAFYTGNRYAGFNNRILQTQNFNRIIPVKEYTTYDIYAGYNFKKINFQAKIANLTDVLNYNVHENYSVNPIAPRQFATTISYKF